MSDCKAGRKNLDRRTFLKATAGALGMKAMGVFIPPGAAIISGCTVQRTAEELSQRLIIAIDERIRTLDPAYQTMALDSFIICNIYDPLTWFNKELKLVPRLALSWESPDEANSWIFKLRPDVKFHDGTPCNADAVKFHFDRIKDPATESKRSTKVSKVEHIEIIDPLTVRFVMNQPDAMWPVVVRDSFAGIVSPTAVSKVDTKEFTNHPVGTGPYRFLSQEGGERIVLERNPDYWDVESYRVPEVEFRTVREPTTRLILLEQGSVDLCNVTFAHTEIAAQSENVEITTSPMLAVRYVGFNNMKPPFDDVRMRRAANLAINRDDLVKFGFRGNVDPLLGPLPTILPNFNKNMETYGYDPDRARALIKEAGYENGVNVALWTKDDATDTNLGVVVADQLRRVGINVEILRYDRNVYWEKFDPYQTLNMQWFPTKEGVFDLFAAGWVGGEHPTGYLDALFRSSSLSNSAFYKSERVDQLLLDSLNTLDEEKRNRIYDELQETIVQDAPWIFCYSSRILWGLNPRLDNMRIHPAGEYELAGVELAGGEGAI